MMKTGQANHIKNVDENRPITYADIKDNIDRNIGDISIDAVQVLKPKKYMFSSQTYLHLASN